MFGPHNYGKLKTDSRDNPFALKSDERRCATAPRSPLAFFGEADGREGDAQARNHHAKTVKHWHRDAAQAFFLFFDIFAKPLLADLIQQRQ